MNFDKKEIIKIYTLLNGTYKAINEQRNQWIYSNELNKYNDLINELYKVTNDEKYRMYKIEEADYYNEYGSCLVDTFKLKIIPVLEYTNNIYIDTKDEVIKKVGALYNSIEDLELQKRCGDILLEASGAFDRVINQATQILEDRIKTKADLKDTNLIGLPLISKAIHSKLENTLLKFSDNSEIQEQYSALFKGIIGVYRNPTHHGLNYECTREDALKFCAYIDLLLKEVDKSEKI